MDLAYIDKISFSITIYTSCLQDFENLSTLMIAYAEINVELYCLIANLSSRTVQAQSGLWDGRTASCLLDWLD